MKDETSTQRLRKSQQVYCWFMDNFVRKVVGEAAFAKRATKDISDWLSPGSEAYAIIAYDNYCQQAKDKHYGREISQPKWTAKSKNVRKGQGWTLEAHQFYKRTRLQIIKDRKDEELKQVDSWFRKKAADELKLDSRTKRKAAAREMREEGWEEVEDDFMSIVEKGNDVAKEEANPERDESAPMTENESVHKTSGESEDDNNNGEDKEEEEGDGEDHEFGSKKQTDVGDEQGRNKKKKRSRKGELDMPVSLRGKSKRMKRQTSKKLSNE